MHLTKIKSVFILILLLGLSACDSSTGVEDKPPQPTLPEINESRPHTDYFNSTTQAPETQALSGAYNQAGYIANLVDALFLGTGSFLNSLLESAQSTTPEYNGSEWVWTYSASEGGYSIEVKLTAAVDVDADEVTWAMYLTTSTLDGSSLDDFKFIDGTTTVEGKTGSLNVYNFATPDQSTPSLVSDWNIVSSDELTSNYTFNSDTGTGSEGSISYTRSAPENTLEFVDAENTTFVIYWDEDTDVGYYETPTERVCWDSTHDTVPCGDVGLEP
ncbi:MAG: hypothetical protein ACQETE_08370 [Bacteroidota bacterium]